MSRFNKMNREEKRSSRLLALQIMYANEITNVKNISFFKENLRLMVQRKSMKFYQI